MRTRCFGVLLLLQVLDQVAHGQGKQLAQLAPGLVILHISALAAIRRAAYQGGFSTLGVDPEVEERLEALGYVF